MRVVRTHEGAQVGGVVLLREAEVGPELLVGPRDRDLARRLRLPRGPCHDRHRRLLRTHPTNEEAAWPINGATTSRSWGAAHGSRARSPRRAPSGSTVVSPARSRWRARY